jgi:acyl-CoA synthetase (AMP-forming)/AMP-acid ligase II
MPRRPRAAFDEDGWFRTCDLGFLRPDGHLTLTGRLTDVIIRKGENVSAKEVEDLLYQHPKVGAVAVIGLPDTERGELVCAVVEPAAGGGVTHPRRAGRVPARRRPDDAEDPGAARGARRAAQKRHAEDPQATSCAPVTRPEPLSCRAGRLSRRREETGPDGESRPGPFRRGQTAGELSAAS